MRTVTFDLPWFPKELSPNSRCHWATVAKHKKIYREAAFIMTKVALVKDGATLPEPDARVHITLEFYPPSKRRYDLDNCLAAMKAGLDGVSDALKIDDENFALTILRHKETGAIVRLTVSY
jgi:crossover junction endodeoxyribonuclease RusA